MIAASIADSCADRAVTAILAGFAFQGQAMTNMADQVVLVTGGARGLGAAISRAFLGAGARVVINFHRSADAAAALVDTAGARALAVQADVTDPAAVGAMVERAQAHFGAPVTTVVNNALADFRFDGDARPQAEAITWPRFAAQFEGSVRGALNTVQAALPGMRSAGGGRVINIGTNLFQNPVVPYHDYTAAKAAARSGLQSGITCRTAPQISTLITPVSADAAAAAASANGSITSGTKVGATSTGTTSSPLRA